MYLGKSGDMTDFVSLLATFHLSNLELELVQITDTHGSSVINSNEISFFH